MESLSKIFELPYANTIDPDRPAIKHGPQTITYGELRDAVRRYAGFFSEIGLGVGDKVALSMPNCPEFIYSYLGVSMAGAVVVPLNLTLTLEEIAYVLRDCRARCLVLHPALANKTDPTALKALGISDAIVLDRETLERISGVTPAKPPSAVATVAPDAKEVSYPPRFPNKPPRPRILADDRVAAILYTSGTTGKPKGAMLSHKNLLANVKQLDAASDLGTDENFLCALPMFHSFGWTVCVLLPLYLGCTITVLDVFRPKEALATLVDGGITVFCGVPAMLAVLARAVDAPVSLPNIKFVISGGAPLAPTVQEAFEAKFGAPVYEGFGLSEASPVATLNPIGGVRKAGSIGVTLPGVEARIVDDEMRTLPIGEVGELAVRGDNVMLGYHNLPDETAQALVDGWLRTGDLAREDEDGYFFIVDRKKDLIIISGFNVYPREIEEALLTHPKVQDAAVVGVPDPVKGETIKAFVVPKEGQELERSELTEFLKPKLARYKIPRVFQFVESLPRSPSGKVLKRLLV